MPYILLGLLLAAAQAPQNPFAPDEEKRAPAAIEEKAPVEEQGVEALELRRRAAQSILATLEGRKQPSMDDLSFISTYGPGGVVVQQLLRPTTATTYISKLRSAEKQIGTPLLIGADLYRLVRADRGAPSAFVQLPSPMAIAAAGHDESTEQLANLLSTHMKVMGFNLFLGPSLALAPSVSGAEGTTAVFGSDPAFAARAGWTLCRTLWDNGVLPLPMGFPGGGQNRRGESPAVLLTPRPLLEEQDLAPFAHVIEQGCRMIHVGNTLVPTLEDSSRPASVSKVVLNDLLREKLGFEGIVVAGPLDSAPVSGIMDPGEAAVEALRYGADMIYLQSPAPMPQRVADYIVHAVNEGWLAEERVTAAAERVLDLKAALAEVQSAPSDSPEDLEGKRRLEKQAYAIERRAITCIQNRGQVLPISEGKSMPVGVTGIVGVEALANTLEDELKRVSRQTIATARHVGSIKRFEIDRITSHIRGIRTVIVTLTDALDGHGQVELIQALKEKGIAVIVVLFGYPGNAPRLDLADGILLAYSDPANHSQSVAAVANVLLGEGPVGIIDHGGDVKVTASVPQLFNARDVVRVPSGRLPLTLSEEFPAGLAVTYNPEPAIKRARWEFGAGDRVKDLKAEYTFETPGRYPVTLTVTDQQGEETARTFHVVATAPEGE